MNFIKLDPLNLTENPFHLIGKDWALITAEAEGKVNTMTASWGGVGVLWNKNVVFAFVRHSRYTFELLEKTNSFSLTFYPEEKRPMLAYCGKASGRNEDKISKSGLTLLHEEGIPYFEEAKLAVLCKKLYWQDIEPENFIETGILPACYNTQDFHRMYVGEIQSILTR